MPIELSRDFVEECNNMCNAFVFCMREAEEHTNAHFDLVHAHDWLCAKAIVQASRRRRRRRSTATSRSTSVVGVVLLLVGVLVYWEWYCY